ncbi:sensor histidine kinase [Flavobacterium sp. AS60]|uniref:tetratricopeptide repeat-containing sensor histidine kinase n=1 Tax=Flavobacterium anseongense TaxID=2910677 RepID=UPI001F2AF347|nr:sensor histidine kinase [Flavobacterium sp. AS60]MCF6128070.1 sensor histidine kinase [Flavobacterium sp. AS60]
MTKTVVFLFITVFAMAQNKRLKSIETSFENLDFNERMLGLKKIEPSQLSNNDKALFYYLYGQTYYANSNGAAGLSYFMKANDIYKSQKNYDKVIEVNLIIVEIKRLTDYNYKDYKYLIDEAVDYAIKRNNIPLLCKTYKEIGNNLFDSDPSKAIDYYQKAILENKKVKDSFFEADVRSNIGLVYTEKIHNYKLARKFNALALDFYQKHHLNFDIACNYVNQADVLIKEKKYDSAMIMYKKAEALDIKDNNTNTRIILYGYMADLYKEMKNYKKALEYTDKQKVYQSLNDDNQQVKAIRDIDAKYKTKEHKDEIAWLKSLTKKGGAVIVFLIVLLILIFLGYKNLRKKKKIVEQEKLIQTQKLENVLQEQELHEIDKLLEGQEKERIKIANDLHDNLGSLLATLKLNFQSLKKQDVNNDDADNLFNKTDELIEEAYQKVRTIAHTKNAGVIANQGLLPAIRNIANKMNIPGKLAVEVIPFGLEERLENALEVTIFRMIQELLTNAIKHANATEISIHLTQHDDSLNIIIEDNGDGFNYKKIDKKDGMGLANIEKKVEQMGGVFTIDSTEKRGTSILIDIPL